MRNYDPFIVAATERLLAFRFPQSSRQGAVEFALVCSDIACQGEQVQASRCYEHDPATFRRLLTNFRAAGCPLLPKRTLRCCLADQADFSICISREQRLLAGRDGPEKNERRKRERDRVCCLYRNRLGRAKARLRAAEFDDVGRGGERTATQTGSGGSLGH